MKHTMIPVILIFLTLLSGCARGDVSGVQKRIGKSVLFSQPEIEDAMDAAIAHFRAEFEGCTLLTMEYTEDKASAAREWALKYGYDEGIVLLSSFRVDDKGGDGSLNPNSTYTGWQWVLVRSEGKDWELKTWGYG